MKKAFQYSIVFLMGIICINKTQAQDVQSTANPVALDTSGEANEKNYLSIGMGLGLNNFMPNDGGMDLQPGNSTNFFIGGMFGFKLSEGGKTYFLLGPEFSYHNFRISNALEMDTSGSKTRFRRTSELNVRKNKLRVTYLNIPMMLSVVYPKKYAPKERGFHISIGGEVGLRLGSKYIIKRSNAENTKYRGRYNLENYRYGIRAEVGYSWFTAFFKQSLSPTFINGSGPKINMFSAGLRLF